MINATTHTRADGALRDEQVPISRIGSHSFAVIIGLELLLIIGVLIWALVALLPSATPLAAPHDLTPVQEAIRARINGAVEDPLIELRPGLSARASNLRGFQLNGTIYYYYVEGSSNYDPYSRGAVSPDKIEVLLHDSSGPATVVIYRLL